MLFQIKTREDPKLLVAPQSAYEQRLQRVNLTIEQRLGITLYSGPNGAAIAKNPNGTEAAIAYHQKVNLTDGKDLPLIWAPKFLKKGLRILLRCVRPEYDTILAHQKALMASATMNHSVFLGGPYANWAGIGKRKVPFHDLFIWGDHSKIIPVGSELNASCYGEIAGLNKVGPIIRQTYHNIPLTLQELEYPQLTGATALSYADPGPVIHYPEYIWVKSAAKVFAYWSVEFTAENARTLMQMGSLLLDVNNIEQWAFGEALLRVEVRLTDKTTKEWLINYFNAITTKLGKLGKVQRIEGAGLELASRAFVPGCVPDIELFPHKFNSAADSFGYVASSLWSAGDPDGDMVAGLLENGMPFIINTLQNPASAYLGPTTSAGKTTLASVHAISLTSHIGWIPLTAGEKAPVAHWVKELGGSVIPLNLPDAYQLINEKHQQDPEKNPEPSTKNVLSGQEYLHQHDAQLVQDIIKDLTKGWKLGQLRLPNMPFTYDVTSGNTLRLLNFYTLFLDQWKEIMKFWGNKNGVYFQTIADNLLALEQHWKDEENSFLGSMPHSTAVSLSGKLAFLVSNGVNHRTRFSVITQSRKQLNYLIPGADEQFNQYFIMTRSGYSHIDIEKPSQGRIIAKNVYVHMEREMLKLVAPD